MAELQRKLLTWKEQLLPKHPMAEAVHYTPSQWEELTVFTSDGAVPIDNNASEREMKVSVIRRHPKAVLTKSAYGCSRCRWPLAL